ncbi:ATP-dependent DNA helicase [bacterium]|nr:ATP-dependent DNA helicase [bacterium]
MLRVPVRALVEFTLRSGDIDLSSFASSYPVEATRIHQRIQRSRQKEYIAEVTVSRRVETDEFILDIGGRIDGVYVYPDRVVIDEIKTTSESFETLEREENRLHWGQAKCYAFMYAEEHDLQSIDIQLTYCRIDTGTIHEIRRSFGTDELGVFFRALVADYLAWAGTIAAWCVTRDDSIRTLDFPFTAYRAGQRAMAAAVYRAVRDSGQLIVQAPTGIGKTMAALFPAVKSIAEGFTSKIFYLTARTTGKTVAGKALDVLRERGLRLKSIDITAKEKICFSPGSACTGDECPYARGHFDRVNEALADAFTRDALTRETVIELAGKHRVCPFEFSLDCALWLDCIICDYNYAFDPRVYLRRFFFEEGGDYTFLVDEAHNLVDRAREMFSAELTKQPFLDLKRAVRQDIPRLAARLGSINTRLVRARKRCGEEGNPLADHEPPADLCQPLRKFVAEAEYWLKLNRKTPFRQELINLFFTVTGFLRVTERYDKSYATCYEKTGSDLTVKLFCMDPSPQMREALGRCRSAVFFSATMVPMEYFRTVLGCSDTTDELILPSPFPSENLCLLIADRISTLYRNRDRTMSPVADMLVTLVRQRKGNYLMFFPSYEYMLNVAGLFIEKNPGIDTVIQTRGMSEDDRDAFLARFGDDNAETLAGFAVLGGIFGEGIDLIGDRLTGAVIVGVGLPGISIERELIRDYFNGNLEAGFEFSYMYPGINKVLQAAGRVIRSETDRGVVLLIDERFTTARYRELLPREWQTVCVKNGQDIRTALETFWSGHCP